MCFVRYTFDYERLIEEYKHIYLFNSINKDIARREMKDWDWNYVKNQIDEKLKNKENLIEFTDYNENLKNGKIKIGFFLKTYKISKYRERMREKRLKFREKNIDKIKEYERDPFTKLKQSIYAKKRHQLDKVMKKDYLENRNKKHQEARARDRAMGINKDKEYKLKNHDAVIFYSRQYNKIHKLKGKIPEEEYKQKLAEIKKLK